MVRYDVRIVWLLWGWFYNVRMLSVASCVTTALCTSSLCVLVIHYDCWRVRPPTVIHVLLAVLLLAAGKVDKLSRTVSLSVSISHRAAADYVLDRWRLCMYVSVCNRFYKQYISMSIWLIFAKFIAHTPYILFWKRLTFDAEHFQDGWLSAILVFEMVVVAPPGEWGWKLRRLVDNIIGCIFRD